MNVIYSTDENYAKICMASLLSLLDNNKNTEQLKVYIIDNNLTQDTKKKMMKLIREYKREIIFISCQEICKDMKKDNDFPLSAYSRLFVQNYINEDKAIYIDCDTVILKSIQELWKINLNENLIAGVQDPLPDYLKEAIEMEKEDRYINSGILLINLKKWREVDFKNKVIKYIEEHNRNVVHHDQGIINGICKGKILYLNPKFNLMPEMILMNEKQIKKLYQMDKFYSKNELNEAKKNPYIVHFISKFYNRPWFKECTHPYKDYFLKYYKMVDGELKSKPLKRKVKMRKYIFENFPFTIYIIIERVLDYKRKRHTKKIIKGN